MNEQITLISIETSGNGFSKTESEKTNTVFCERSSISQREFFETSSQGLKAEFKFIIWSEDYHGEKLADYVGEDGKQRRYRIYRTYQKFDKIEIYLARES